MKKSLTVVAIVVCVVNIVFAGEDVVKLLALAKQGDADAQCRLGVCYVIGDGVKNSDAEAVKWFRKSAEQGYAKAQGVLGYMYGRGRGVDQSHALAVK